MKKYKKVLSIIFVTVFLTPLVYTLITSLPEILAAHPHLALWQIGFLLGLSILLYFVNAFSWHLIVTSLGSTSALFSDSYIWIISNLARYLPGGIWQYPARAMLQKNRGVSTTLASTALVLEIAVNVFVGALLILLGFVSNSLLLGLDLLLFTLFIGVLTYPPLHRLFPIKLPRLSPTRLPPILLCVLVQFLICGSMLFLLVSSIGQYPVDFIVKFTIYFALSWLAGYVSIFSPSGLGVQETSLTFLLAPLLTWPLATLVALLFRLFQVIGELLTVGIISLVKAQLDRPLPGR